MTFEKREFLHLYELMLLVLLMNTLRNFFHIKIKYVILVPRAFFFNLIFDSVRSKLCLKKRVFALFFNVFLLRIVKISPLWKSYQI